MEEKSIDCNTDYIPKVFWKYFDLYRRKKISIQDYAEQTNLPLKEILCYLELLKREANEK